VQDKPTKALHSILWILSAQDVCVQFHENVTFGCRRNLGMFSYLRQSRMAHRREHARSGALFCLLFVAGWNRPVTRKAHNLEVPVRIRYGNQFIHDAVRGVYQPPQDISRHKSGSNSECAN